MRAGQETAKLYASMSCIYTDVRHLPARKQARWAFWQVGLFLVGCFFFPQNPEYQIFNALKPQEELLLKLDTARIF